MAKFPRYPKLSKEVVQEIIVDLCEAIASTRNSQEAARLLTDLLGKQELEMIAKRLRVAELLLEDYKYEDIAQELKTSPSTIARIQAWLQNSGEGYRMAMDRTKSHRKQRRQNDEPLQLRGIKKKYPLYFWPQVLLENWIKNSTKKEKQEMRKILQKLDQKTETYRELESLLKQDFKIISQ